jgi:TonB family protein
MMVTALRPPPLYGHALLRNWLPPRYPEDALKERLDGSVTLRLAIDERGHVVSSRVLEATDPRFVGPAQDAVKEWTFSPALDASVPVACSMDTTVVFSAAEATYRRKARSSFPPESEWPVMAPITEATLASTPDIDYPDVLFDRKLSGKAHYICTVLANGRVANPRIVWISSVDFVAPALNAIENLQYHPRMQGDQPIEAEVEGDLRFDLMPGSTAGALAANFITAPDGNAPSAVITLLAVVDPIFPFELLLKGKKGAASVGFTVRADGSPTDVRVVGENELEFGKALVAAVEMTTFSPPYEKGRSTSVQLVWRAAFQPISTAADGERDSLAQLLAALRRGEIGNGSRLDNGLEPRYQVAPRYPESLKKGAPLAGQAVIEFVIDQNGRARFPRIASCTLPDFGWSAATAVSQWVFDVPRTNGKATAVRARVPFDFKALKP